MNPSLLLIPDRYKASKLYSQIPDSGAGDLAFTRANDTATRVNSAGLIEKVRTNLILQSEDFTTTWSTGDATVTANTTANPLNGALTADTITLGAGTTQKYALQLISINGNFTASVYLKAGGHQFIQFLLGSDSSPIANFDLTNGTASATNSTASIVSAGNGWYRCSMSFTSSTADGVFILAVDSLAATRFASTASTGTFIAFGYQLETGDIATPYIPTTTAAVSVGPVANIPRIDYTGGGCGKLLLEPQRTNVCLYSEDFSNAAWGKDALGTGATPIITANYTISPDGTQNADRLQFSAVGKVLTSDYSLSGQFPTTLLSGGTMTFYMKSLTSSSQNVLAYWGGGQGGVFVATPEWQRFTLSNLTAGTASPAFGTRGGTGFTAGGDEVLDISVWGVQVEAGSYATSYIPTLGASVTRSADAASKTGISSLIGVNGGSILIELDANGVDLTTANYVFDLSDGVDFDRNRIAMYWTSLNNLAIFYGYGGTFSESIYNFNFLTTKKIGVRWTSTQIQVVVNGVAQTALTYGNSSPTKLNIASRFSDVERLGSNIKVCALYNNTLSTAELQTLTTL